MAKGNSSVKLRDIFKKKELAELRAQSAKTGLPLGAKLGNTHWVHLLGRIRSAYFRLY